MRWLPLVLCAVLAAGLVASATSAVARGWIRPVEGPLVRAFSVTADRFAAGQHRGVDLGAAPGTRVLSACAGRVSFAGRVPGGGRTVSVRCGGLIATYQHLGAVAIRRGQALLPGARIGTVGHAKPAAHVHLGARDAVTGDYRDPLALFADAPRAPLPLAPAPGSRRPAPFGRGPRAVRVPPALGPAPAPARGRAPAPLRRPPSVAAPPHARASDRLPWPVWLGLGLVALGLPLSGGLVAARRRHRAPAAARVEALHPGG